MLNYSTTDLNIFLAKAEHKLVELGEKLIVQVTYDTVENCLLDKIYLLTEIIDAINDTSSQEEINVLVFFALDYYDLYTVPYSPFSVAPTLILSNGGGSSSGVVYWSDILDKPNTFPASQHTHPDNDILVSISGITEFRDRFDSSFTGNLQDFITKLMIKYQAPSFTSFTHISEYNGSDVIGNSFRLGQPINGDLELAWGIANPSSVKNAANSGSITISETSPFTSNLPFNLFGTTGRILLFSADYTKTTPGTLTLYLNGVASDNTSMNSPSTSLTWYSEIFYGNSTLTAVDETIVESFPSTLTNNRQISFTISGSGYKYVFIPDNINQTDIKFIDPNSGFEIAMNAPSVMTINNAEGVALEGKLYRSKNSLGAALTVNIQ